jgi:catechol 2,3-dioxygenase-like lactoylglutathione lyase family enzyme
MSTPNLIARDWRALAAFYESVLGCVRVPPERAYAGPDLERGTGVPGAALSGVHLRMPGWGDEGPTLEMFSYTTPAAGPTPAVHRPGFAHIAFAVPSVKTARDETLAAGGQAVGEVVTLASPGG